jgi:hypothetical protein
VPANATPLISFGCVQVTSYMVDGKNVAPDVQRVLAKIKQFSELVRKYVTRDTIVGVWLSLTLTHFHRVWCAGSGEWKGVTGKPLTDIVAIGIG